MSDTNNKPKQFWLTMDVACPECNSRHVSEYFNEYIQEHNAIHVIEKRAYDAEKERAAWLQQNYNESKDNEKTWIKKYDELKSQAEKLATALNVTNKFIKDGSSFINVGTKEEFETWTEEKVIKFAREALSHWADFKAKQGKGE